MPLTLDSISSLRIPTLQGAISNEESFFLYNIIKTFKPKTVCELGVASGWSTSIILMGINELMNQDPDIPYRYSGIDKARKCYYDSSLDVGYVVRELLSDDQYRGQINLGKDLTHFAAEFKPKEIDLLFIDANHKHPCPAMDLLAAIPYLKDDAVVALHDTNLPIIHSEYPTYGAKHLFEGISTQFKFNCPAVERNRNVSNMGAFLINDMDRLEKEIEAVIYAHEFETELQEPYLSIDEKLRGRAAA